MRILFFVSISICVSSFINKPRIKSFTGRYVVQLNFDNFDTIGYLNIYADSTYSYSWIDEPGILRCDSTVYFFCHTHGKFKMEDGSIDFNPYEKARTYYQILNSIFSIHPDRKGSWVMWYNRSRSFPAYTINQADNKIKVTTIKHARIREWGESLIIENVSPIYYLNSKNAFSTEWIIYFDKKSSKIAAKSVLVDGKCVVTNYWKNGNVKSIEKCSPGKKRGYGVYYCENGTRLESNRSNGLQIDTTFYCNGKPRHIYNKLANKSYYFSENGESIKE